MFGSRLSLAVEAFAARTGSLTEAELEKKWVWRDYDDEGVRFAFFRTYEELRELAARLFAARASRGPAITAAQRALAQYHQGFRDLQAVMLAAGDEVLDMEPAAGDWSMRRIAGHIMETHLGFWDSIRQAVKQGRTADPAVAALDAPARSAFMDDVVGEQGNFAERVRTAGTVKDLIEYFNSIYERTVRELEEFTDDDLSFPAEYWEKEAYPVRFRIHRFDSHLRQHLIQLEKTLASARGPAPEAQRLVRLIYGAQAEVEGVLLGTPHLMEADQDRIADGLVERLESVEQAIRG